MSLVSPGGGAYTCDEGYRMLSPKIIGAVIGLVIGVMLLLFGPLKAFLLVLFILAGWLVGKFWMGEIDLIDIYDRFMSSRGKRPRR